jgi:hypothetical protein
MPPSIRREIVKALIATTVSATSYRYWLDARVLQYLSIGQWRFFAILVAAAGGGIFSMFGLPTWGVASASIAGLLLGGTWEEMQARNDVRISVNTAFTSHLESFWREVIMLTVTATIGGFCCARLRRHRSSR